MSVQEILTAIEQLPPEQQQQVRDALDVQHEADRLSAYDKIKDLIGKGSGLRDVSANKAHMRGFGERSLS